MNSRFPGEAGTDGIPVSLYWIDQNNGKRTLVTTTTTGDQMGMRGRYYFVPLLPGKYQVKVDSSICLVDTIKFDKKGWSDTLELSARESIDQGWVVSQSCPEKEEIYPFSENDEPDRDQVTPFYDQNASYPTGYESSWNLFPNPSSGYLHIETGHDEFIEYRIYNTLGRLEKSGLYHLGGTIAIHDLPSGVYHVQLYIEATGRRDIKKVLLMN